MAEQYFAAKDKDLMAPKPKKAMSKGPMKKIVVFPRKGQKEYEDVERLGRKPKRVIEVPMKAKEVVKTVKARQYSKAEKAMLAKINKKLQGVVKKRAERAEARAFKPLTLEEQNIKKQLEQKLEKGIEAAKSPEQKKMEQQMLLALEAAPMPEIMAIEAPKGKAGRPPGEGNRTEIEGMSTKMTIPQLKAMLKDYGVKNPKGNKKDLLTMLEQVQEEEARPKAITESEVKSKKEQRKSKKQIKQMDFGPTEKEEEELRNYYAVLESPTITELPDEEVDDVVATVAKAIDVPEVVEIHEEEKAKEPKRKKITVTKRSKAAAEAAAEAPAEAPDEPITGKGLKGGSALDFLIKSAFTPVLNLSKAIKGGNLKGGSVKDFIKGLASKAIDYVKKDPIGALKSAVNIGKQAYEHGSKAKEMYDKFFKGPKKGGSLQGLPELTKKHVVHRMYMLNKFLQNSN